MDHHNTPVTVELGTATGVNRFDEYGLDWQGDQADVFVCLCMLCVCMHACMRVCVVCIVCMH